jgi:Zn-dependent peptidase ImmA (M78 family)
MKFKINNREWEIKEISNEEMIVDTSDLDGFTHGTTEYSTLTININKSAPDKRKTLIHELTHCFMYEFGHNQHTKEFNHEDVCEICACSHDIIHEIVEKYFKDK